MTDISSIPDNRGVHDIAVDATIDAALAVSLRDAVKEVQRLLDNAAKRKLSVKVSQVFLCTTIEHHPNGVVEVEITKRL